MTTTTYLKNGQDFFQIGATGIVVAIMGTRIQTWTQDKAQAAINYAMGKGKAASKYEFESALRKAMDRVAEAAGMRAYLVAQTEGSNTIIAQGKKDLLPHNHKPWLNPGTRDWTAAVESLQSGKTTIAAIRTSMRISRAAETKLMSEVEFQTYHKGL